MVQGGDLHNRVKIIWNILEITTKLTIETTGKTFDMVDAEFWQISGMLSLLQNQHSLETVTFGKVDLIQQGFTERLIWVSYVLATQNIKSTYPEKFIQIMCMDR